MFPLVCWNPVNLLDVEARWLITEILVLLGAFIFSKLLGLFLRLFDKRLRSASFHMLAEAVYSPCIFLIWFFVSIFSINLVTDDLFKENYPKLFSVIINGISVSTLGWFLLRLKNGLIARLSEASKEKETSLDTTTILAISKLLSIAIALFILVLLHDATGMSLTTFLAFGGVGGLALAFASQEIFSNFFGGLMIHITRPFTVGETVFLPTHQIEGIIEEIGWYQTRIRSLSKVAVYVPNSLFTKALLVNKSRITLRLVEDTLSFSIYPLTSVSPIIADIKKYLDSHQYIDKTEWSGARVASFNGPICNLIVTALLTTESLPKYYHERDQILLQVGEIISAHGGILSYPHIGF